MKKLVSILIFAVIVPISAFAQDWSLQAKQNAVKIIKSKLKAPSTFILTNEYGEKIPISKIRALRINESVEYDSVIYDNGKYKSTTDSIEYIYNYSNKLIDSVVYTSYKKTQIDSIVYKKTVYLSCYKCSFYYEAQNSLGGMVQDFAVVYVTKDAFISKYIDYNDIPSITYKIGKKEIFESVPIPPVKIKKTYVDRDKPLYRHKQPLRW